MAIKAAVAVLGRFTGMFLSDLCLCAKAYVSYADGANGRVCLCRASKAGQCDATCVCLCTCLRVFVSGIIPRTVPHLGLNKFRAPLGYRGGLVLGLNVSYFFGSLATVLPMEHVPRANTTNGSRRHNYVTKCGQCWPIMDTRFCACMFYFYF